MIVEDRIARLALVDWPEGQVAPRIRELRSPDLPDRAVLLVRRMSVVADPDDVPAAVADEVRAGAAAAVRPVRGALAPDAEAVLFEDESEMLACYLFALWVRALDDHWCWPLLRHTLPPPSLGAVVGDPTTPVLGVLAKLSGWARLGEVVGALDRATQWRVLAALAERHALWLRDSGVVGSHRPHPSGGRIVQSAPDPARRPPEETGAAPVVTGGEARLLREDRPGVTPVADSVGATGSVTWPSGSPATTGSEQAVGPPGLLGSWQVGREGSTRVLWHLSPHEEFSAGLERLTETLLGRRVAQRDPNRLAHRPKPGSGAGVEAPVSPAAPDAPAVSAVPAAPAVPGPGTTGSVARPQSGLSRSRTQATVTTRREWSGAEEADPEHSPEESGVHTELGGVLYLVNLLARFDVHDFGLGDASAWDVVDGLARAALPHSEPSSPRLTDQAGSSVRDEFTAADPIWDVLASLAGRPAEAVDPEVVRRCVVVLRALEPALAFTDDETTWGSLLGVSGRVVADATHVELFTSAEQVHLAVRRRALDSDPGWVPALGRVVLFHFVGDQP